MVANDSHDGETTLAVEGYGIYFYFGRKKEAAILNNVNIAVKRGAIYSLLGPSGCGKTTLLKCIIGQHKPQAGSLKIYGRTPGSKGFFVPGRGVGYMPQDLALYMEMSTEEILTYFGSLYGMSMKNIRERMTFLVELLELPSRKKLINCLSGGQQRRVSFAIALIHKPPLLILDEPTVGVDPLLRKAIWNHLVSLASKENLTIIITTHYTEEARQAHTVGLMRSGHLLVETNPDDLINQCGVFTLEDVFLKFCQEDTNEHEEHQTNCDELMIERNLGMKSMATNGRISDEHEAGESYTNTKTFANTTDGIFGERNHLPDNTTALLALPPFPTESDDMVWGPTNSRTRLFYLTRKNFLRLKRNIFFTFFVISATAIQITLFFLCLSSDPFALPIAVVNEEDGLNKFGEQFVLAINNRTFQKKPFQNFSLAYESLKNGESWAALHINPNFSTCLVDRILGGMDASNETIRCSTIKLMFDASNYAIAGTIRKSMFESYQAFTTELLKSLNSNPLSGEIPLDIEEYSHGSKPITATEYIAPALILCILYVMSIASTQMCIIAERKRGLLSRALVAGATTTEVLLSFFFALLVLMLLQLTLMLVVAFYVFNMPCNGSALLIIFAATLSGICGMSYGFLISCATDDENSAAIIGFGSFFLLVYVSAALWPLESMNYYLRYLSYALPLTRIIESARSAALRGWNITDNYLWDGYLICSFWSVVQVMLSIILLRIRK